MGQCTGNLLPDLAWAVPELQGAHLAPPSLCQAPTGLLFGLAAYEFGLGLALLSALVLISVLVILGGTDFKRRLLPNVVVGPAALVGFVLFLVGDPLRWWVYLVSALGLAVGLFAFTLAYPGGKGMGDVKMGGMLGTFLGPYAVLAVFFGALLGAIVGGALMDTGVIQRRSGLPFGVFLSISGVVVLFFGQEIWNGYLRLIGMA